MRFWAVWLIVLAVVGLALRVGDARAAIDWPRLDAQRLVGGFTRPVGLIDARDGSGRLFVLEKSGIVRVVRSGVTLPDAFVDLRDRVESRGTEQGLLGLAFPPSFPQDPHAYVDYTRGDKAVVVSRFRLADADHLDPTSEEVLLTIPKRWDNHNGGQLAFGPRDGYLYIGVGDGGQAGPLDPDNNAQTVLATDGTPVLLGKLLRIDVAASPYAIPPTNPLLAGRRTEIWAMGLRNPWRFSFDRGTGDLYIADVGQSQWEEINVQPAGSAGGENYGWRYREGTGCITPVLCDVPGLLAPTLEYSHEWSNCAVVGGYVYRGERYPRMQGIYFYGDYCTGRIWGMTRDGSGAWQNSELRGPAFSISAFGEDASGELYAVDFGGWIYRLLDPDVVAPPPTPTPVCDLTGSAPPPAPEKQRVLLPLTARGCAA